MKVLRFETTITFLGDLFSSLLGLPVMATTCWESTSERPGHLSRTPSAGHVARAHTPIGTTAAPVSSPESLSCPAWWPNPTMWSCAGYPYSKSLFSWGFPHTSNGAGSRIRTDEGLLRWLTRPLLSTAKLSRHCCFLHTRHNQGTLWDMVYPPASTGGKESHGVLYYFMYRVQNFLPDVYKYTCLAMQFTMQFLQDVNKGRQVNHECSCIRVTATAVVLADVVDGHASLFVATK